MIIRDARPEDAAAMARVHVESWRATYRGIVPDDVLDGLSVERRQAMWSGALGAPSNRSVTLVVEDASGEVVGFAHGGPARGDVPYDGELYAIYLLPERQGRGAGRRLVQELAARLGDAGYRSMIVWVLAENPARGFYEALGGQPAGSQPISIGGAQLEEVAYAWPNLTPLRAQIQDR